MVSSACEDPRLARVQMGDHSIVESVMIAAAQGEALQVHQLFKAAQIIMTRENSKNSGGVQTAHLSMMMTGLKGDAPSMQALIGPMRYGLGPNASHVSASSARQTRRSGNLLALSATIISRSCQH